MNARILQDHTPAERLEVLRANAYTVIPEYSYTRELEEGEIQDRQDELSQAMIKIDNADQVLKGQKEVHSAAVKPLKEQIKGHLQEIRTRSEEVSDEVFLMKDDEAERMLYYNKEGVMVYQRRLQPNEMQYSIVDNFKISKNG